MVFRLRQHRLCRRRSKAIVDMENVECVRVHELLDSAGYLSII